MNKMIQAFPQKTPIRGTTIDRFLESISPENRVIFMRRYWFCDTYAEIAVRYGISERKAKRQIHRTREQLADDLDSTGLSFSINQVDFRFVREAESVVSLREGRIYLYRCFLIHLRDILTDKCMALQCYLKK